MDRYIKALIYRAYLCWSEGEPLSVDSYMALSFAGVDPDMLWQLFDAGHTSAEIFTYKEA